MVCVSDSFLRPLGLDVEILGVDFYGIPVSHLPVGSYQADVFPAHYFSELTFPHLHMDHPFVIIIFSLLCSLRETQLKLDANM